MIKTKFEEIWPRVKKDLPFKLTITKLMEKYNITRYVAGNIKFAISHLNVLSSRENLSAQAILKMGTLESQLNNQKRLVKDLKKKDLELQETLNHVLNTQIQDIKPTKRIILQNDINETNGIAIAVYTDQHIGKIVSKDETNGWNEHNPDIAIRRFHNFSIGVIDEINKTNLLYKKKGNKIETLFLAFLGDGIQGRLREEDLETNAMHPTQESKLYKELIIESIRYISENSGIENIKVILIWGNHGRTSLKLKFSAGWANSYEYLAYQDIELIFKNYLTGYNNVEFYIPKSGIQEAILYPDFPITFSHGFNFNYRGGVGGIEVPMHTWHYMMREALPALRRYIGHWHIYKTGTVSICGSGLGYDGFCMHHKFTPEVPAGFFEIITVGKGYSFNKKIRVDELLR